MVRHFFVLYFFYNKYILEITMRFSYKSLVCLSVCAHWLSPACIMGELIIVLDVYLSVVHLKTVLMEICFLSGGTPVIPTTRWDFSVRWDLDSVCIGGSSQFRWGLTFLGVSPNPLPNYERFFTVFYSFLQSHVYNL